MTRRLALLVAAMSAVAALPSAAAAGSAIAPEAVTHARVLRVEVSARYRLAPGRKLVVTEATTMGVVATLTLIEAWLDPPRLVPAANGIYFALCPARATCPYPAPSASRPAAAFLPQRQALELALRTFLETSADLVVVALPTAEPVWVVFQRDDLLADADTATVLDGLAGPPWVAGTALRNAVQRLTRPRLFVPLPMLPPPDDTIFAVWFFAW